MPRRAPTSGGFFCWWKIPPLQVGTTRCTAHERHAPRMTAQGGGEGGVYTHEFASMNSLVVALPPHFDRHQTTTKVLVSISKQGVYATAVFPQARSIARHYLPQSRCRQKCLLCEGYNRSARDDFQPETTSESGRERWTRARSGDHGGWRITRSARTLPRPRRPLAGTQQTRLALAKTNASVVASALYDATPHTHCLPLERLGGGTALHERLAAAGAARQEATRA